MPHPHVPLVEKSSTSSTNDDARALALSGAPHGAAVLAERQTAGRGRSGRAFVSPEGGLYLSVVVRPNVEPREWALLPLLAGVVVARELKARGFEAAMKWPNDVLVAGKKAGGILVESRWGSEPFAVVGIGLNLASAPVPEATAVAAHGAAPERRELARAFRAALAERVTKWGNEAGSSTLLGEIRAECATLGRAVSWDEGEGVATDVDASGALLVETSQGVRRVVAGDVRLRVA